MKRIIAFLVLFLAISYSISAQNKWKAIPEPKWETYQAQVNEIIVIKSIKFEKGGKSNNTTEITKKTQKNLDKIAVFLAKNSKIRLEIRSHTTESGVAGNQLSTNRAKVISDYLVSKTIQSFRLNATGYANTMPSEEWGNDRVEFRILTISEDE